MGGATITNYKEDEIILRQGDPDKSLYKILSGTVALYMDYGQPDEYLVGVLFCPKCFGEMTVLSGQPSYYTAVALRETSVLRVPAENFDAFIQNDYKNALAIMKTMAENFSLMNTNMHILLDELRELRAFRAQHISQELEETDPNLKTPILEEEAPKEEETISLFPPGHKGYPGVTHPEYRTFVYSREYICPNCKVKFTGDRTFRSKLLPRSAAKTRYDLYIFYKNFQPEWYDVVTCPHCCFSALSNFFLEPKLLKKERYEERLLKLQAIAKLDFQAERDLDFVFTQHYLALACAKGFPKRRQLIAYLWDNLKWLYESADDLEMASMANERAIAAYQDVYTNCGMEPIQEQRLCMKIAGMLYLSDRLQEARKWAFTVRRSTVKKTGFSDLAQRMIEEIRERTEQEEQK